MHSARHVHGPADAHHTGRIAIARHAGRAYARPSASQGATRLARWVSSAWPSPCLKDDNAREIGHDFWVVYVVDVCVAVTCSRAAIIR